MGQEARFAGRTRTLHLSRKCTEIVPSGFWPRAQLQAPGVQLGALKTGIPGIRSSSTSSTKHIIHGTSRPLLVVVDAPVDAARCCIADQVAARRARSDSGDRVHVSVEFLEIYASLVFQPVLEKLWQSIARCNLVLFKYAIQLVRFSGPTHWLAWVSRSFKSWGAPVQFTQCNVSLHIRRSRCLSTMNMYKLHILRRCLNDLACLKWSVILVKLL